MKFSLLSKYDYVMVLKHVCMEELNIVSTNLLKFRLEMCFL